MKQASRQAANPVSTSSHPSAERGVTDFAAKRRLDLHSPRSKLNEGEIDDVTLRQRAEKVIVVAASGGFCIQVMRILRECPKCVDLVVVGPPEAELYLRQNVIERPFRFRTLAYKRIQRRSRSLIASIPDLVFGTFSALQVLRQERADAVIGMGQRAAVYFLIAARVFKARTIFIECITRVTKPSVTGRIVAALRLADELYVQWPQTARSLPGSVYKGRIV